MADIVFETTVPREKEKLKVLGSSCQAADEGKIWFLFSLWLSTTEQFVPLRLT